MCMFHNPFKVVPLHLVKYFQKTKKVSIFRGDASGVKIDLALGIYI